MADVDAGCPSVCSRFQARVRFSCSQAKFEARHWQESLNRGANRVGVDDVFANIPAPSRRKGGLPFWWAGVFLCLLAHMVHLDENRRAATIARETNGGDPARGVRAGFCAGGSLGRNSMARSDSGDCSLFLFIHGCWSDASLLVLGELVYLEETRKGSYLL